MACSHKRLIWLSASLGLFCFTVSASQAEDLAFCYRADNEAVFETKIDLYTRCIREGDLSEATKAVAYNRRGIAYKVNGHYERAIQDYNTAIDIAPYVWNSFNNRGNVYIQTGQYDLAIDDFNKALELNPEYMQAFNNRGNAYYRKGQYERAIQNYLKAIELKPDYAKPYRNMGYAYMRLDRKAQSVEAFLQAMYRDQKLAEFFQRELLNIGFYAGVVDGKPSPELKAALEACLNASCLE